MDNTLIDIYERVKSFDIIKAVEYAVNVNADRLSEIQVAQQYAGLDSNGTPIEPPYTPKTKSIKQEQGQPFDRVTLRDTGEFHEAVIVYATNGKIIWTSLDPKTLKIEGKYQRGDQSIWGFSPQHIKEVRELITNTVKSQFYDEYR